MNTEIAEILPLLSQLVEAGVPLKDVAQFAGISAAPMTLPSGAAGKVQIHMDAIQAKNSVHDFSPELLRKLKLWVMAVRQAEYVGPEFAKWVADHVLEISGTPDHVRSQLYDIAEWVRACLRVQTPKHVFNAIFVNTYDPDPE